MWQRLEIWGYVIRDEIRSRINLIGKRFRLGDLLVVAGIISRDQLRDALKNQKLTGLKLGDQLIADGAISRYILKRFLFKQWMHRVSCATAGVILGAFSVLLPPQVSQAGSLDNTAAIITAKADITGIDNLKEKDNAKPNKLRLFSYSSQRYNDLSAFTKWNDMLSRLKKQADKPSNAAMMKQWQDELNSYMDYDFKGKVEAVNRYVNEVKYHPDKKVWGKTDFWATPFEFFKNGGDCEDYAITKMMSLKALGVDEKNMRITIVHDMEKNIPHAVLVVYDDNGEAYILDNQSETVEEDTLISHYKPIFSISQNSWWRYNS